MAMQNSEPPSGPADSDMRSYVSMITKAEIRYEGHLISIDPDGHSIILGNVRSFGSEGRRKNGPQINPSDEVYKYIQFRGSEVASLQVISSIAAPNTTAFLKDPATIQGFFWVLNQDHSIVGRYLSSHGISSAYASTSLASCESASVRNHISIPQQGHPSALLQSSVPLSYPSRNIGNQGSLHPSNINGNDFAMPISQDRFDRAPGRLSKPKQQYFLRAPVPSGLAVGPRSQQSGGLNISQMQQPLLPTVSSVAPPKLASFPMISNLSFGLVPEDRSSTLPSKVLSSNLPLVSSASDMPKAKSGTLPSNVSGSSLPIASSTSDLRNNDMAPHGGSSLASLLNQFVFECVGGTSRSHHVEPAMTLSVTPALNSHRDVDIVQTSTNSTDLQALTQPQFSQSIGKIHKSSNGHGKGSEDELLQVFSGADHDQACTRGRGKGVIRAALDAYQSNQCDTWEQGQGKNAVAFEHGNTSQNAIARKTTVDSDFEVMNKKFNDIDVWVSLGKNKDTRFKEKEDAGDYDKVKDQPKEKDQANDNNKDRDSLHGGENQLLKSDPKPVNDKDGLSDVPPNDKSDNKLSTENAELNEQKKRDYEEFNDFQRRRFRRGGPSRVSYQSRWGFGGRGYSGPRRGQKTIWRRVSPS